MLNINSLNGAEQEGLQKILEREETSWTESDKAHLRARWDYLSGDDKERLESVSEEPVDTGKKSKAKKAKDSEEPAEDSQE